MKWTVINWETIERFEISKVECLWKGINWVFNTVRVVDDFGFKQLWMKRV